MGPLIPAVLTALLVLPAAASAQSRFDFEPAERALDQDLDPAYAADFLKDIAAQHANQAADPDREARLLQRAAELKDMSDILVSYDDPDAMNEALRLRLNDDDANPDAPKLLGFGAHPDKLLAWRAKYFADVPDDAVRAALWEWTTLSPEQKGWLSTPPQSLTESKWEAASFSRRFVSLREWAAAIYDRMMKAAPKTRAELEDMQNSRDMISSVLDGNEKRASDDHLTKAAAAVDGLARLEGLPESVRESSDPEVRGLLAQARAGATPEETLAALDKLFDKAAVRDDDVRAQAPDRPDQKLSSLDPKTFGDALGAGLRAEIGDVDAGRPVARFFETHPLDIKVRDLGSANLAQFDVNTGEMAFNERFISDWIKSQGLSARAVISDPPRLHELVMILAPAFVHESTHQIQKAYADDHGIYDWNAQNQEIEAMEVQSDYTLEKEARDPAYRQFLARTRDSSISVQDDLALTAAFQRDPRSFRAVVMNDYYAGLPSLEEAASASLLFLDANLDALRAEQRRRAALSATALQKIESAGFDKDKDFKTIPEWKAYLTNVKTSVLEKLIAGHLQERAKMTKTYELTSVRMTQALDRIENDAASVIRGDAAPASDAVPPPGTPR